MTTRPLPPVGLMVAACLLSGALLALRLPTIPSVWLIVPLLALGMSAWRRGRQVGRVLGALAVGFAWALIQAQGALSVRLPPPLQGRDVQVQGRVIDLPEQRGDGGRFVFRIDGGEAAAQALIGKDVRLNQYAREPLVQSGERWAFTVRLRRPRGVLNPGGFDFEKLALQRRLAATGYVRDPQVARRLTAASGLDAWRDRLAQAMGQQARFVRALALGDTRALSNRDWEVLRATGLTHLIAISGFHVGLLAGFGALLARLAFWLWPRIGLYWPRPQAAAVSAFAMAGWYTAAAGFALPTVRTLLMIGVLLLARLLRRPAGTASTFALALIAVLLADPLAVLAPGFWLSFLGVGWLLWCLPGMRAGWRGLLSAQAVSTIGLLPLSVWFFAQASLAGPLANLVGIPWISLIVVPLSLLAGVLLWISPVLGGPAVAFAQAAMDLLWQLLEAVADLHGTLVWLPAPSLLALLLAIVGAFWLLLPRGLPARWLGGVLFLPLLWPSQPRLPEAAFSLDLLDVGQGLSVLVRTRNHALLFDAGPAVQGRFDMGEAAVVPALHALGLARLDALVVSHGDNDHAGGAAAVARAFAPMRRYKPAAWQGFAGTDCQRGGAWRWDGVDFTWLHPPPHFPYLRNDSSCVLRISSALGSALLPGDIEAVIEQRLLREQAALLPADVLLVPHHGSTTSSSSAFVTAVSPHIALLATGHGNRFGLPRAAIVRRYRDGGALLADTADAGLIRVRVDAAGAHVVQRWRDANRRLWHERDE